MARRKSKSGAGRATRKIVAIDLFCGAGGLTRGLEKAGVDVKLGVDTDPACEYPYEENNRATFLLKSVDDLTADELQGAFGRTGIRLLAGCAPCQPFSSYNQKAKQSDSRWWLLQEFARLIREVAPELVTMENVPGLTEQRVFKNFVKVLVEDGYYVDHGIVNCADYGIPQHRERLVLLASKLGPIELCKPSKNCKKRTVRRAIGNLPEIDAGGIYEEDPLHQSSGLSPINMRRIKASTPGGTWRDWDKRLVAKCHKKGSGKTYPSVYGRMTWDDPSPAITTQFYGFGNGRFGHPEQDRAISLREGAILQSFPRYYRFTPPGGPIHKKVVGRLIGNAVPVKLGEIIGRSISKHVSAHAVKKSDFSEVVKEIRDQLGLSQQELAAELGVSFATVNRWENSHTRPSKLAKSQLEAYCERMTEAGKLDLSGGLV